MTTPAEDIAQILIDDGEGLAGAQTSGLSVFISLEPASPDQSISVFDTGGLAPNPKFALDQPTMQVRVRGARGDYPGAYAKAQSIKNTLLGITSRLVNTNLYVGIYAVGEPFSLGDDDSGRPIIISNWRTFQEPSALGNRVAI